MRWNSVPLAFFLAIKTAPYYLPLLFRVWTLISPSLCNGTSFIRNTPTLGMAMTLKEYSSSSSAFLVLLFIASLFFSRQSKKRSHYPPMPLVLIQQFLATAPIVAIPISGMPYLVPLAIVDEPMGGDILNWWTYIMWQKITLLIILCIFADKTKLKARRHRTLKITIKIR